MVVCECVYGCVWVCACTYSHCAGVSVVCTVKLVRFLIVDWKQGSLCETALHDVQCPITALSVAKLASHRGVFYSQVSQALKNTRQCLPTLEVGVTQEPSWSQSWLRFVVCLHEAGWNQACRIQRAVFLTPVIRFWKRILQSTQRAVSTRVELFSWFSTWHLHPRLRFNMGWSLNPCCRVELNPDWTPRLNPPQCVAQKRPCDSWLAHVWFCWISYFCGQVPNPTLKRNKSRTSLFSRTNSTGSRKADRSLIAKSIPASSLPNDLSDAGGPSAKLGPNASLPRRRSMKLIFSDIAGRSGSGDQVSRKKTTPSPGE